MTDILRTKHGAPDSVSVRTGTGTSKGCTVSSILLQKRLASGACSESGSSRSSTPTLGLEANTDVASGSLEYLCQVASLEHLFVRTVENVNKRVFKLVQDRAEMQLQAGASAGASIEQELRACWDWLTQAHKCAEIHLKTAAQYHQFYHELYEVDQELKANEDTLKLPSLNDIFGSSGAVITSILKECTSTRVAQMMKLGELHNRAWKLRVPQTGVSAGVGTVGDLSKLGRKATMLCAYQSTQFRLEVGDEVQILDNDDANVWRVRTRSGEVGEVPSLSCQLNTVDCEALDAVVQLRHQLGANWHTEWTTLIGHVMAYLERVLQPFVNGEAVAEFADQLGAMVNSVRTLCSELEG